MGWVTWIQSHSKWEVELGRSRVLISGCVFQILSIFCTAKISVFLKSDVTLQTWPSWEDLWWPPWWTVQVPGEQSGPWWHSEQLMDDSSLLSNGVMGTKPCWDTSRWFDKHSTGFYKHVSAISGESKNADIVSHITELLRSAFQLYEERLPWKVFSDLSQMTIFKNI